MDKHFFDKYITKHRMRSRQKRVARVQEYALAAARLMQIQWTGASLSEIAPHENEATAYRAGWGKARPERGEAIGPLRGVVISTKYGYVIAEQVRHLYAIERPELAWTNEDIQALVRYFVSRNMLPADAMTLLENLP